MHYYDGKARRINTKGTAYNAVKKSMARKMTTMKSMGGNPMTKKWTAEQIRHNARAVHKWTKACCGSAESSNQ